MKKSANNSNYTIRRKGSLGYLMLIAIALMLITSFPGYSQEIITINVDIQAKCIKKFSTNNFVKVAVDDKLLIKKIITQPTSSGDIIEGLIGETVIQFYSKDIENFEYLPPSTQKQAWDLIMLKSDFLSSLSKNGFRYDLRRELEDESLQMLMSLENHYGFFEDDYLNDYLQQQLYRIHSITLGDGRPGNINIKVLMSSFPNAFVTPTGTIVLTTGLLSTIRSEDELLGILAHEVSHFVLDHIIVNIIKQQERQKKAEFWAGVATMMATASEFYLATKYDVNTGGSIAISTAILSSTIANSISERIGNKYSIEQEVEADKAAVVMLGYLKKDPKSLSAALTRIKEYLTLNGYYQSIATSGTHPSIHLRINAIGKPNLESFVSVEYDRIISLVNTYNSINEFNLSNFTTASNLANRNILANVGVEWDYIIKSMAVRALYNTPESNEESYQLLKTAKSLNVIPNIYCLKQEGITLLRLGRNQEAIKIFGDYLSGLKASNDNSSSTLSEIDWTKQMIYKSKHL